MSQLQHGQPWHKQGKGLRIFLIVALILGIGFRLIHLDHQVYWHDEAYTSLRMAGYTSTEVIDQLFQGQVVEVAKLQPYQSLSLDKSVIDTVRSLALEDTQHPPLYYVLVRSWAQLFGNSVASLRSLSVLCGLCVFPSLYWLCRELERLSVSGQGLAWMAIALVAVSPLHVLYAQEAREYALWTVMILISSSALLRALRLKTRSSWSLYALTLTLGLYTFPLTLAVAIAQGMYVGVLERGKLSQTLKAYLLAMATGLVLFSPWLFVVLTYRTPGLSWTAVPLPLLVLGQTWGLHVIRALILTPGDFGFDTWLVYLSLPPLLLLLGYAIAHLCQRQPLRVWLLVLGLLGSTFLVLALPDLILGGQRSSTSRYLMPSYLGGQLAIADLLTHQTQRWQRQRRLWQGITVGVIGVGLLFCAINTQRMTVWTKGINYHLPVVAQILNQAPHPLLISDSYGINFGTVLALSHVLDPKVKLLLLASGQPIDGAIMGRIPPRSDRFLLNPSEASRQFLEQQPDLRLDLSFHDTHLWLWSLSSTRSPD